MYKKLFLFLFVSVGIVSCSKTTNNAGCQYTESMVTAPASEVATLQAWITANHPAAVLHPSGFFYEITAPGTGGTAALCSYIVIKYSGYLLSGFKFDENLTGATLQVGKLILGWQKGIPLIKPGGSIILYVPPTLGYGSAGSGSIPPNSYLIFTIQLLNIL